MLERVQVEFSLVLVLMLVVFGQEWAAMLVVVQLVVALLVVAQLVIVMELKLGGSVVVESEEVRL